MFYVLIFWDLTPFFLSETPEARTSLFYHYMQTCFYCLVSCFSCMIGASTSHNMFWKDCDWWLVKTVMLEPSGQQDLESSQNSLNLVQCIVSVILMMHKDIKVKEDIITIQVRDWIGSAQRYHTAGGHLFFFLFSYRYILQIHVSDCVFTSLIFFAVLRSWL